MAELNFKSRKRSSGGMGKAPKMALRLILGGIAIAGVMIRLELGA
ncbi:hypothetical protein [Oceanicola sp. 22II-s10i]|nr:hypothetical protein [Oceanicola sp. 22II-s10i]